MPRESEVEAITDKLEGIDLAKAAAMVREGCIETLPYSLVFGGALEADQDEIADAFMRSIPCTIGEMLFSRESK